MKSQRRLNKELHSFEKLTRMEKRKALRKEARKKREWSPTRPTLPDEDSLFSQVLVLLNKHGGSVWEKANMTGLSTSTLYNWQNRATRYPRAVSLQMAAKALGARVVILGKDNSQ